MRRAALIGGAALLLCAAGVLSFILLRPSPSHAPGLLTLLEAVDASIAGGYLSTAQASLEGLRTLPSREDDLMRLLKRAHAVSSGTGDFTLLADIGSRALAAAPGSAAVRSIAAYGLLRAGRLGDAEKALSPGGSPSDVAALLGGEIALRRGAAWKGSDSLSRDLLKLESDVSPAAFAAAALRTGDDRLSLDAALLAMGQGDVRQAWTLARTRLGDARFDEPAGLILYDEGDAQAVVRLGQAKMRRPDRADLALVLADATRAIGRTEEAEALMKAALPMAPSLSWTPYADLAFFSWQRGDRASADRRLIDGLAFFPGARGLVLRRARLAADGGQTAEAISLLEPLVNRDATDGEAGLLLISLQSAGLSPEAYRARLWKLFDRVPANAGVFATLSDALMAAHDWDGAGIALGTYRRASGASDADALLVSGLIALMQGRIAEAEATLRQASQIAPDGRARFNLALLAIQKNDPQGALREIQAASDELAARADAAASQALQSRLELVRGFAYALDGSIGESRKALARALMADSHNLRASLLARKLAAGGQ